MAMPILKGLVGSEAEGIEPEGMAPADSGGEMLSFDDLTPEEIAALEGEAAAALQAGLLDGIEIAEAGAGEAEPPADGTEAPAEGVTPSEEGEGEEGGEEGETTGELTSTTGYVEQTELLAGQCEEVVGTMEEAAKDLADPKLADGLIDEAWDLCKEAEGIAKDAKKAIKKDDIDLAYQAHEAVRAIKETIEDRLSQIKSGQVAIKMKEPEPEEEPEANPMGTWAKLATKK